jgi:hypothetical protein
LIRAYSCRGAGTCRLKGAASGAAALHANTATAGQHDAYSAAAWMRIADLASLCGFLSPFLTPPECALAQVERWIGA